MISPLWVFHSSFILQFLVPTRAGLLLALLDPSLWILSSPGRRTACVGKWLCPPSFQCSVAATVHAAVSCAHSRFKLSLERFPGQLGLLPAPGLWTEAAAVAHNHSLAAEVPLPSTRGQAAFARWSLCKHTWTPRRLYPTSSNCPFSREVNQICYISVMTAVSAWVFCLWQKIDKPWFSIEIVCYDYISFPCSRNQYIHIMVACYLM